MPSPTGERADRKLQLANDTTKLLNIYQGHLLPYVETQIKKIWKEEKNNSLIVDVISSFNLLKPLIERRSKIMREGLRVNWYRKDTRKKKTYSERRTVVKANEETEALAAQPDAELDAMQAAWDFYAEQCRFDAKMQKTEKLINLARQVMLRIGIDYDGKIPKAAKGNASQEEAIETRVPHLHLEPMLCDLFDVYQDIDNPEKMQGLAYLMSRNNTSVEQIELAGTGITNGTASLASTKNIAWTSDAHFVGGQESINPYGFIPAVIFRDEEPDGEFFLPIDDAILSNAVQISVEWSHLSAMIIMQANSQLVLSNIEPVVKDRSGNIVGGVDEVRSGPAGRIALYFNSNDETQLKPEKTAEWITPSAKIDKAWAVLKDKITTLFGLYGLRVEAMSASGDESGVALKVKYQELMEYRREAKQRFYYPVRDLVPKMVDVVNKTEGFVQRFPENWREKFDFEIEILGLNELPSDKTPDQLAFEFSHNLTSPFQEFRRLHPDLDEDGAHQRYAEIRLENDSDNGTAGAGDVEKPRAVGGVLPQATA